MRLAKDETNIAMRPFGERRPMMLEITLEERGLFRVHRMVSLSEIRRSGVEVLKTDPDDVREMGELRPMHGRWSLHDMCSIHMNCRMLVEED